MSCTLKQINIALDKLKGKKDDRSIKAITDLKDVQKDLLIMASEAVEASTTKVSAREILNAAMEEDPTYVELVKQLEEVKEGKAKSVAKQLKSFENLKEKGGKGRVKSAEEAIAERTLLKEQLLEDILFLEQEIAQGAGKKVQTELKKTKEYLELVNQHIAENNKIKKDSKSRVTREKNAVQAIKDTEMAKLAAYDAINEFKKNFNTNTKLLENNIKEATQSGTKYFNVSLGTYLGIKTPNNMLAVVDNNSESLFIDMANASKMAGADLQHIAEAFRLTEYTEKYIQDAVLKDFQGTVTQLDIQEVSNGNGYTSISSLIYESVDGPHKHARQLPKSVATTMAIAINEWLAGNSNQRWEQRTDDDVNRFLGRSSGTPVTPKDRAGLANVDFIHTTVAQSIGSSIIKELGLTTNEHKCSGIIKDKVVVELGLVAMHAMQSAKLIKLSENTTSKVFGEKEEDSKKLITVEFTDKAKNMMDHRSGIFQKATETSSEVFGSTSVKSKPRMHKQAPREHSNQSAQGEWLTTPKETQDILNKIENTSFKWDSEYVLDILDSYNNDKEATLEVMGWKDPASVHITKRKSVEGRNKAIEREMENMASLYKDMAEAGNTEMFFNYFFGKNGRLYMDSSAFNPQNTKLHRFAVYTSEASLETEEDFEMHKIAMAQAFGIDIDKLKLDSSIKKFDSITKDIEEVLTMDLSIAGMIKELSKRNIKGHDPEHMVAGIIEYRKQGEYFHSNGKSLKGYVSHLPLEIDAVTSGYILKTMQMPLIKEYDEHIESGGVFSKKDEGYKFKTFGDQVEDPDTLDAYLRPAKDMIERVIKMYDSNTKGDPRNMMASLALNENILTLKKNLNSPEEKERKDALKKFRDLMKPPFMVFNYGAGMDAIITSIIYGDSKSDGAIENLYKLVVKAANGDEASIGAVIKYIKASATKYTYNQESKTYEAAIVNEQLVNDEIARFEEEMGKPAITDADENFSRPAGYDFILDKRLEDNLVSSLRAGIGAELEATFEATYKANIEANKTLNKSFAGMFKLFKVRLDAAIASKQKELGRDILESEYNNLVDELSEFMPAISHALAGETSDKLMIFNEEQSAYEALEGAAIDGQGQIRTTKKFGNSAYAKKYALVEAAAAGAVIPIHYLDASIMVRALQNTDALNVFDAIMTLPGEARQVAKDYNKATIELSREYSITEEMLKTFANSMEKASVEELLEVNKLLNPTQKEDGESIVGVFSELLELNRKAVKGRNELFSKDIIAEHLAVPGGEIEVLAAGYKIESPFKSTKEPAIITESETSSDIPAENVAEAEAIFNNDRENCSN